MLLTTLAAQLTTLPILLLDFGQFSMLSFFANILILPSVPFLMTAGFLLVGVSFASMPLAGVLSWPAYFLLSYYLWAVDVLSKTDIGLFKF
jgi:competence protein ComEC